jgi:hypothetical protein
MSKSVSPALINEISELRSEINGIAEIVALVPELRDRLDSILSQLQSLNEPPREVLLNNAEARSLLGTHGKPIGENTLCAKLNNGTFTEGIHYTGTHKSRRWKKSRLEFWIEHQRDAVALKRKMIEWERESRSA